jgi:hypothetical protein
MQQSIVPGVDSDNPFAGIYLASRGDSKECESLPGESLRSGHVADSLDAAVSKKSGKRN